MRRLVGILIVVAVLLAIAVLVGCKDKTEVEDYITFREIKAFDDGRRLGLCIGRWEAYDLGFADGQKAVINLADRKVYLQPILNKRIRLKTLDN